MNPIATLGRVNPDSARSFLRRKYDCLRLRGASVECLVCGYQAKHFADSRWHVGATCPKCRTDTRHRLLAAALKLLPQCSYERYIAVKRILHFAPERIFGDFIRRGAASYASADLSGRGVDLRLDIANMPQVADASFDCCIACDVLEHVDNDRRALAELHRVLSPGGVAIITVPQRDGADRTYEDASITTPAERFQAYGQADHVRMYGADIVERMTAAGFRVDAIGADSFEPADAARFVLRPPVPNPHPLATNHRRVFFCHKGSAPTTC
jgi:SAM-dependent methyltransferase